MSNRDIVVIGGSTGATAPMRKILAGLPADLPAAVFVVLHTPANSTGILATVASAAGPLPVRTAEDGLAIKRGHVYVAAPDHHVILADGHIKLGRGPRENLARPAIDPLFRSAAASYGPRVIGVLLSGLLNDGAVGIAAIKSCGGIAVVQDPSDAIADEMPRGALHAAAIDLCVTGDRLGGVITDLVGQTPGPAVAVPPKILLEIEIAAGGRIDSDVLRQLADPVPVTCPDCGGVLSEVHGGRPLRFRCQVGHGFTAETVQSAQQSSVDEAMRVALRIIEERAELVARMAREARQTGRSAIAEMYETRAAEYRTYAETIRQAVLRSIMPAGNGDEEKDSTTA